VLFEHLNDDFGKLNFMKDAKILASLEIKMQALQKKLLASKMEKKQS